MQPFYHIWLPAANQEGIYRYKRFVIIYMVRPEIVQVGKFHTLYHRH